jgi:hypothetical protein
VRRALAIIALTCQVARGDTPAMSGTDARVAYIAVLLDAIEATDQTALANTSNYIYVVERNKCQAPDEALHVGCLLEAAGRNCVQSTSALRDQCRRASDVIVTNRLSEKAFVPEAVRYQIMDSHRDYRTAFARELHRRYAILVAELAMSQAFAGSAANNAALAAGIERYCREIAGSRGLAWQSCVAAIVWFIGTGRHTVPP